MIITNIKIKKLIPLFTLLFGTCNNNLRVFNIQQVNEKSKKQLELIFILYQIKIILIVLPQVTVMHSMQAGYMDKAQKYTDKALMQIEKLKSRYLNFIIFQDQEHHAHLKGQILDFYMTIDNNQFNKMYITVKKTSIWY